MWVKFVSAGKHRSIGTHLIIDWFPVPAQPRPFFLKKKKSLGPKSAKKTCAGEPQIAYRMFRETPGEIGKPPTAIADTVPNFRDQSLHSDPN